MEMFGDNVFGDIPVTGLLDLLGLRYTGSGPGELYLSQDKGLTKKLLAFEEILYPRFAVFSRETAFETGGNLRMPLFVKPLRSDASLGIGGKSLVHDADGADGAGHRDPQGAERLRPRRGVHRRARVLRRRARQRPAQGAAADRDGLHRLPGRRAQGDGQQGQVGRAEQGVQGHQVGLAQLPDELRARLQKVAVDAYRALRVRDYGRVDLRLTETGEIYVLEVNASCYLEKIERVRHGGRRRRGWTIPRLIERIVNLALARRKGKK